MYDTSDFFLEEADEWRNEAWDIIRQRPDVTFSLLTKRAHRIKDCPHHDWGDVWDNVFIAVSCENQKRADERIPLLVEVPAKHKWASLKPFIGEIDLEKHLATGNIETVLAGGENYECMRPLRCEWVKKIYDQCIEHNVEFFSEKQKTCLSKMAELTISRTPKSRLNRHSLRVCKTEIFIIRRTHK